MSSTAPPPPPADPNAPPAGRPHGSDSFFDSLRRAGVVRTHDRWIGGVAGGIARRLGIDPLLVRGILVVLTLFGGLALLAYGLAWALLPEESDGRIHLQEAFRGRFDAALAGAAAFVVVGLSRPAFWFAPDRWAPGWLVVVGWIGLLVTVAVVALILTSRSGPSAGRTTPPPGWVTPPTGPEQTGSPMTSSPSDTPDGAPSGPGGGDTAVTPYPTAAYPTSYPTATYPTAPYGTPAYGTTAPSADAPTAAPSAEPVGQVPPTPYPSAYTPPAYTPPASTQPAYNPPAYTPPTWEAPPARPRASGPGPVLVGVVLALCLFAGAGVLLAERAGALTSSTALTVAGLCLTILGLGVLLSGVRGRRSGVLGGLAVLVGLVAVPTAAVVAAIPTWGQVITSQGIVVASDTTWAPTTVAEAEEGYGYSVGKARVDLTGVPLTKGAVVSVPVRAGAGSTTVVVPTGEPVEVQVQLGAGDISSSLVGDWTRTGSTPIASSIPSDTGRATRTEASGTNLDLTLLSPTPGPAVLVVTVEAGLGDVTIEES